MDDMIWLTIGLFVFAGMAAGARRIVLRAFTPTDGS